MQAGNPSLPLLPASRAEVSGTKPEAVRLDAGDLFAGRHEVIIAHGNELYRLRLTRQNRLILTK